MQMTLLKREKVKQKNLCLLPKYPIVNSQNLLTEIQKSARNQKLIAKKKTPVVGVFFKRNWMFDCGRENIQNQERFRTMITIKTMVCQIKNTLPQKMVFCGKD